jgi:hypothetical protein
MNYFNQNLFIVIVILVVTMNVDQTANGLAGIVRRVVQNNRINIWGSTSRQQQKIIFTPVQVLGLTVVDNTDDTTMTTMLHDDTTSTVTTATTVEESFFDADSYRQEMTDLVYQRNMQRMNQ